MSKSWSVRIVPLVCAAVMMACGGSDGRREDRAAESLQGKNNPLPVTLTGCVQAGTLETKFVLENVRTGISGRPEQSGQSASGQTAPGAAPAAQPAERQGDAPRTENTQAPLTIADGSIVQLRSENEPELHKYVGQQVSVTGTLVDSGASTIGTGGAQGNATPSGDRSMAAATDKGHAEKKREEAGPIARSSMANGTAPIVQVTQITPTGQQCGKPPVR
jgi:hypothetical protein